MKCRHCHSHLNLSLVDLGSAPPSNAYLDEESLHLHEKWFPLNVYVCETCWLGQTKILFDPRELKLFKADYAYFSSYSTSWLSHCQEYVSNMIQRFNLNKTSLVIEVAANDGYLLQYVKAAQIPCLGIEPTLSTSKIARKKGIPITRAFFGIKLAEQLAQENRHADLIIANNVLAHVPDINDFVAGFEILLKSQGVATFEFPHFLKLIEGYQFDTIYHEHFSYLSLTTVKKIFETYGLTIFDVQELPTHGGSLRIFTQRTLTGKHTVTPKVDEILQEEMTAGITRKEYYTDFQIKVNKIKHDFLSFLLNAKIQGKKVIGYGAAAKANTFFNYAGIRNDLLAFLVDLNPAKQGKFTPGSRIPIYHEAYIEKEKPDYIIILPWNLKSEIMNQLSYIKKWGGQFVTAIPNFNIEPISL